MIIKGTKGQKKSPARKILIGLFLLLGIVALTYWLWSSNRGSDTAVLLCDAEKVEEGKFIGVNGQKFNNGGTQSSEKSYSGRYSSKLDGDHRYGMGYTIKDISRQVRYIASVRRLTNNPNKSGLAMKAKPGKDIYIQSTESKSVDDNGWELLEVELTLPDSIDIDEISAYTFYTSSKGEAYFDDLKIEMIREGVIEMDDLAKLHLYLDQKALNKINDKRYEAMKKGILQTGDNDWVKAKLTENDSLESDVKVRLKGDWTDHLKGDYWSYRIKMPSDRSWNRMQTFSLQDPHTRYYLYEWLYHKALEEVDVITPRYGFVEFGQNEKSSVLYAYEEHFDKQVAEYKNRREGVIMKFSEDYMWNQRLRNKNIHNKDVHQNVIHNSDILPFKQAKTFKSPKLTEQFLRAQDLMEAFKNRTAPASEVFDMELLARHYAVTDIFNANHGLIWHNLRFYYNPITRKLEPIGFDGYTESGHYRLYTKLFFGEFKSSDDEDEWSAFYKYIFRDPEFIKYYVPAMVEYSSDEFINELLDKYDNEIYSLEKLIRRYADSDYQFDVATLKKRARTIHQNIKPLDENSMKVFVEKDTNGNQKVLASNYHNLPLVVVGSGATKEWDPADEISTLVRSNGRKQPPSYTEIKLTDKAKYVFYKLPGGDKIYYCTVKRWNRPGSDLKITYSKASEIEIPLDADAYKLEGNEVTILSGNHSLSKRLLIPEGYKLTIMPGTNIDMVQKAYMLSYSPVQLMGTKDDPILITSSDKTSQGFAVLQADKQSQVLYTSFTHLNTLEEGEWQMTGAVTFYESDVEMTNVTVSENNCEDALNLVRSNFSIRQLNINNTFADGFDGDFCKGKLMDSYLWNTGNDGLDYSGSWIEISDVLLENIGDKGISAGEEATLDIRDVTISKAQIGIASKDLSKVKLVNTSLKDCTQGFAAYRKKPEFGGGFINVKSYTEEGVERLINKDEESTINLPK